MNNLPVLSSIDDGAIVINCSLTLGQLALLRMGAHALKEKRELLTPEQNEENNAFISMFTDTINDVTKEVNAGTYDRKMVHGFCL